MKFSFTFIAVCFLLFLPLAAAHPSNPVQDRLHWDVDELQRGYTSEDYFLAKQQILLKEHGKANPRDIRVFGSVFLDTNQNGRLDDGEKGLSGIKISDGEEVTRTDETGNYAFAFQMTQEAHHRFVFITEPTGYRATSAYFVRVRYDEERKSYNMHFGLQENPLSRRDSFSFISGSDTQFTSVQQMLQIEQDYAQITDVPGDAAFMTIIGDLTNSGTHYEFDMYDRIRSKSKIRVMDVFGGHDGNCLDPRSTLNYEVRVGPTHYSWEYGGVHFIQFVTELHFIRPELQARQEKWIENDLASLTPGTRIIVATHYPLKNSWLDRKKEQGYNIILQLAGHWHTVQSGSRGDVPVVISAPGRGRDSGAFSRAYSWVHVSSEGVRTQVRIAGQYERLELLSPAESFIPGTHNLVALAYDSASEYQEVTCTLISPARESTKLVLRKQGDWAWYVDVDIKQTGTWQWELQALDDKGRTRKENATFQVNPGKFSHPTLGDNFEWMLSGNPARNVKSEIKPPLYPLWVRHTGATHVLNASPIYVDGCVFVSVTNPVAHSPGSGVLCLDARSGTKKWFTPLPRGDIGAALTYKDGSVFALTSESWLMALDARTGQTKWAHPLQEANRNGQPLAINQACPVPTSSGLLVNDWPKKMSLIDYQSGEKIKTDDVDMGIYPIAFPVVNDNVAYAAKRRGSWALQIPDGKFIWQGQESARSTSGGLFWNDVFYYSSSSGIRAINTRDGERLWSTGLKHVGRICPVPVKWGNQLLVNGETMRSLNLETGEEYWSLRLARDKNRFLRCQRQSIGGSSSPIVTSSDLAFFGHDDMSLRAVDKQGNIVWEYYLGTPIKTSPVISGNLLYVYDFAGNLWCFSTVKKFSVAKNQSMGWTPELSK